jgi:hypothetical protein
MLSKLYLPVAVILAGAMIAYGLLENAGQQRYQGMDNGGSILMLDRRTGAVWRPNHFGTRRVWVPLVRELGWQESDDDDISRVLREFEQREKRIEDTTSTGAGR